jgi:hypothetical protein
MFQGGLDRRQAARQIDRSPPRSWVHEATSKLASAAANATRGRITVAAVNLLMMTAGLLQLSVTFLLRSHRRYAVELSDAVHLTRRELRCNRAHPHVDVILAHTLGKGRELTVDIRGLLPHQRRRAELDLIRTMTCGASGNATGGVSVEYEPNGGSVLVG